MQPGGPLRSRLIRAIHDRGKTRRAHTLAGSEARQQLRRGHGAHVFTDGIDLDCLEQKVWTEGKFIGSVDAGQRGVWERFAWRSLTPVGTRFQTGRAEIPLYWVEIKGRLAGDEWVYHLVPRPRPAGS